MSEQNGVDYNINRVGPRPFMECFYALADVDRPTRHVAAKDLLNHLNGSTINQVSDNTNSGPTKLKKPDMNYTIKRLVRGLGSSRGAARQGFSLALSEVLRSFSESKISTNDVIAQLDNVRTRQAQNQAFGKSPKSGQDERDLMFAGIFGCIAIQQSGRLENIDEVAGTTEQQHAATSKLVTMLLSIAKKKTMGTPVMLRSCSFYIEWVTIGTR